MRKVEKEIVYIYRDIIFLYNFIPDIRREVERKC
jgi:hypothetical protein